MDDFNQKLLVDVDDKLLLYSLRSAKLEEMELLQEQMVRLYKENMDKLIDGLIKQHERYVKGLTKNG